ncbi:protein involved in polysaccharide export, contains SLBB domain of the beta-grasp fold [Dyadobacter koreensis]|uniref:Protein involved in polysaccharide export, contains SLBB domain of the beta-grasp fold n=1 Tax=Dyadobacter koreensis TaxID=408657 RepID=A0A1H6RFJ0_9BACT|nr:SLBB domain-containing protein [Dyadobacter koreensis]SEI54589.1 protein involved in polysaccharide export, contains SLBB domain of the beta-grasp fold [Dyadobacter koreensis]
MNTFKLAKNCKFILPYLLSLIISLPGLSQVVAPQSAPTSAPTSTGTNQSGSQSGTPRSQSGAQGSQGNQGAQQGTQQGNQPANSNQQSNQQKASDAQAAEKAKAAANNDPNAPKEGADQTKINTSTTGTLSAEEQEKLALRQKIYGYSIFADKQFNPIPDLQIATPTNYVVGPGDELNIYLYNYAEATYKTKVSRDGFITIERLGNIYVSGRTIEEVRKILIDKFSKFTPGLIGTNGETARTKLMVTLGEIRNVKVFVTGEVINPGTYEITSLASAFNALYQAGGPNEIGSFRDVRVVRAGKVVSHMDIYDYLVNGKIDGDIRVQDNDNIVVGYYKKRVEITGMVKRQGIYELKEEEKLADVLKYAGGFNDNAYKARVKIERFTARERKIVDVPEQDYATADVVTGDLINVETILDRIENIVTIEGAVMRQGSYSLDNSGTLKKLIENAQGLREDAFTGRISVLRTRTDLTIESIQLNLADVLNNNVPDLVLTRLDQVVIPSKFDMAQSAIVTVEGEVNNPKFGENDGKYPYVANMTLEDVLVKAGGFKESAFTTEVEVIRRKRNSIPGAANAQIAETFKFNVNRDLSIGNKESNFVLLPFDQVIVRKSPNYVEQQSVFLEGEILVPGSYTIINKSDKISDIIKRSGGLTELAYPEGATLLRRTFVKNITAPTDFIEEEATQESIKEGKITGDQPNVREESIGIKLSSIMKNPGSFEDLVVQEGDIIRIPKRLETVQVTGEVLYPTTVKYGKGLSFIDYISHSGGFTTKSLRKSSYIKYPNGSVDRTRKFMFFNVYPKVQPGSEIFVPVRGAPSLTPQQAIQTTIGVLSSVMTLIVTILAFRTLN